MYSCNISGYTIFLIIPVKAAAQQNFPLLMLVQCRSFISRFYHISPILCMLHWLPVEFRIHFKIIIITFKAIHGQAPVYLQELISKREEKRYNLRSCAMGIMLQTPRTLTKKTLGDRAFLAAAPKLWNGLPSQIRNEPNFNRFKGLLKTHFFRLAFY